MVDLSLIGIVITIASVLIGIIVAHSYYCKTQKNDEIIQKKQKVQLDVLMIGEPLFEDPELYEIIYGIPEKSGKIVTCHLQFDIRNTGETTAEEISFSITSPLNLTHGIDISEVNLSEYMISRGPIKHEFEILNNRSVSKMYVHSLHPRSAFRFTVPLNILYASIIPIDVGAITADGVPIKISTQLEVETPIVVRLSAKNYSFHETKFNIRTVFIKNKKELNEKIMENETKELREQLKSAGLPQDFINSALFPYTHGRAIVVVPKLNRKKIKINNKITTIDEEDLEKSEILYLKSS